MSRLRVLVLGIGTCLVVCGLCLGGVELRRSVLVALSDRVALTAGVVLTVGVVGVEEVGHVGRRRRRRRGV